MCSYHWGKVKNMRPLCIIFLQVHVNPQLSQNKKLKKRFLKYVCAIHILIRHFSISSTPLKVSIFKLTKTFLFLIEIIEDCIISEPLDLQIYIF